MGGGMAPEELKPIVEGTRDPEELHRATQRFEFCLVLCWLWLQARSQADQAMVSSSQAKPSRRLDLALASAVPLPSINPLSKLCCDGSMPFRSPKYQQFAINTLDYIASAAKRRAEQPFSRENRIIGSPIRISRAVRQLVPDADGWRDTADPLPALGAQYAVARLPRRFRSAADAEGLLRDDDASDQALRVSIQGALVVYSRETPFDSGAGYAHLLVHFFQALKLKLAAGKFASPCFSPPSIPSTVDCNLIPDPPKGCSHTDALIAIMRRELRTTAGAHQRLAVWFGFDPQRHFLLASQLPNLAPPRLASSLPRELSHGPPNKGLASVVSWMMARLALSMYGLKPANQRQRDEVAICRGKGEYSAGLRAAKRVRPSWRRKQMGPHFLVRCTSRQTWGRHVQAGFGGILCAVEGCRKFGAELNLAQFTSTGCTSKKRGKRSQPFWTTARPRIERGPHRDCTRLETKIVEMDGRTGERRVSFPAAHRVWYCGGGVGFGREKSPLDLTYGPPPNRTGSPVKPRKRAIGWTHGDAVCSERALPISAGCKNKAREHQENVSQLAELAELAHLALLAPARQLTPESSPESFLLMGVVTS
ncbi:hypothetical protein DFH06DRAFT_1305906 [Mycena polygramma]|nr:hypothetical protein DFH06DRAFT_1305906 [Mycena polygramma]